MRVVIRYVVNVEDGFRRALRHYFGETGLTTAREVEQWYQDRGSSGDADLESEHRACCWTRTKDS